MKIDYIHEPTDLQCGQAVLAMLLGTTAEYICKYLDNDRETDLREMKRVLTEHGIGFFPQRRQAHTAADLPPMRTAQSGNTEVLALVTVCGRHFLRSRAWHFKRFSSVGQKVLLGDISRDCLVRTHTFLSITDNSKFLMPFGLNL